jgi:uncharacterized protein YdbL (DUF1318 family)
MKKGFIAIIAAAVIVFITYKYLNKGEQTDGPKAEPIAVNTSNELTSSISASLAAYYSLKDAFVQSDTALINPAAAAFAETISAIDLSQAKADTTLVETARQYQQTVSTESNNITTVAGIDAKRKSFQATSDAMFDLLRVVRYNGGKVYQQFCPMAFNNTGANWLSNSDEIRNPYFGAKMLECGEVRDSVSVQ